MVQVSVNTSQYIQEKCSEVIHMFKNHFTAANPSFPIQPLVRLILQAVLILNLLWQANVVPNFSVYAYLCGLFDYNGMTVAPLGCKVLVHKANTK